MSGNENAKAIDELYAVDPSEFTDRRNALVKELKKAGDKEGAAAIAARRKPTQIAYVLNQLARKYPDAVGELVDVGRELAREQRKALRGEASHGLRESIDRQRKAISEIGKQVAALMKELGLDPSAHLQEVTMALQAALVDPAVGAQLEEGRLEKAPEAASSFGGEPPADMAPPKAREKKSEPPPKPKKPKDEEEDESAADRKKREAAERKEREREEAEAREREAQEKAAKARAKAEHAKALAAAKAALHEAKTVARDAHRAAERAAKEAERADGVAAAAERELTKVEAEAP